VTVLKLIFHNLQQALIALDCLANVLVSTLTGNEGFATETLSAHAWRARDKPLGRFFIPPIDWLFSWQKPDPAYSDENGPVTGHCRRAFLKERARSYLPAEYREEPHP
jgi:hypothetical protein